MRYEIETKRNRTKRNQTKRNESDRNEIKRNETKRRYISFRFVSVSLRTLHVTSFDSWFSKNAILELIVFNLKFIPSVAY